MRLALEGLPGPHSSILSLFIEVFGELWAGAAVQLPVVRKITGLEFCQKDEGSREEGERSAWLTLLSRPSVLIPPKRCITALPASNRVPCFRSFKHFKRLY